MLQVISQWIQREDGQCLHGQKETGGIEEQQERSSHFRRDASFFFHMLWKCTQTLYSSRRSKRQHEIPEGKRKSKCERRLKQEEAGRIRLQEHGSLIFRLFSDIFPLCKKKRHVPLPPFCYGSRDYLVTTPTSLSLPLSPMAGGADKDVMFQIKSWPSFFQSVTISHASLKSLLSWKTRANRFYSTENSDPQKALSFIL